MKFGMMRLCWNNSPIIPHDDHDLQKSSLYPLGQISNYFSIQRSHNTIYCHLVRWFFVLLTWLLWIVYVSSYWVKILITMMDRLMDYHFRWHKERSFHLHWSISIKSWNLTSVVFHLLRAISLIELISECCCSIAYWQYPHIYRLLITIRVDSMLLITSSRSSHSIVRNWCLCCGETLPRPKSLSSILPNTSFSLPHILLRSVHTSRFGDVSTSPSVILDS